MARMVGMHVAAFGSMKHHLDVEICFSSDYSEKGNEISRKASIVGCGFSLCCALLGCNAPSIQNILQHAT